MMHPPPVISDLFVDQDAALHKLATVKGMKIGRNHGKVCLSQGTFKHIEAATELVISQGRGVIAQRIHRGDHRMGLPRPFPGGPVAKGTAMQEIAVVEKDGIRAACPRDRDLVCKCRKAKSGLWLVPAIIPAKRMRMQIGCRKQAQGGMDIRQLTDSRTRNAQKN